MHDMCQNKVLIVIQLKLHHELLIPRNNRIPSKIHFKNDYRLPEISNTCLGNLCNTESYISVIT